MQGMHGSVFGAPRQAAIGLECSSSPTGASRRKLGSNRGAHGAARGKIIDSLVNNMKLCPSTRSDAATAAPSHKPRWSRRKDARRGELVNAALDLFVERGFAATRAEDVAARAGVSKGTLYLYFDNKEALFQAVVRDTLVAPIAQWAERIETSDEPTLNLLRALMYAWWERIGATKVAGITKLIFAEAGNFPELARFYEEACVHPGMELFQRVLARAIQRGEIREIDTSMTAQALIAPMVMLIMRAQAIGPCAGLQMPEPKAFIDLVIDMAWHGLERPSDAHVLATSL